MSGKNDRKIGGIFKRKMLILTPQASVSGIGLIPGRNIYISRLVVNNLDAEKPTTLDVTTIQRMVERKLYSLAQMSLSISSESLPGQVNIFVLCHLPNNSPLSYHTRDKLGCCIISYRNIISFLSRHFLGIFSAKLKLPLNRDTPTLLLNLYLTYLDAIFILFSYFVYDQKLNMEGEDEKMRLYWGISLVFHSRISMETSKCYPPEKQEDK